jgi:hypothetical protein
LWGGYDSIHGGVSYEALISLTGLPCTKLRLGRDESALTPDKLFDRLHKLERTGATITASCGGGKERDAAATKLGLRPSHSYAILAVQGISTPAQEWFLVSDPHRASSFAGAGTSPVPQFLKAPPSPGAFWIPAPTFFAAFNLVVVCFSLPFSRIITCPSVACAPQFSFFADPADRAQAAAFVLNHEANIFAVVSQQQVRNSAANVSSCAASSSSASSPASGAPAAAAPCKRSYFDIGVFIFQIPGPGKAPVLVAVSDVTNDRMSYVCARLEPGHYIALPFSMQQHAASPAERDVSLTLLACTPEEMPKKTQHQAVEEHRNVQNFFLSVPCNAATAAQVISGSGKALEKFMQGFKKQKHPTDATFQYSCTVHRKAAHKEYNAGPKANNAPLFETLKLQLGHLFLGAVRNLSSDDKKSNVHLVASAKANVGLTTCFPSGIGGSDEFECYLQPGEARVFYAAVPQPFADDGTVSICDKLVQNMKIVHTVPPAAPSAAASVAGSAPALLSTIAPVVKKPAVAGAAAGGGRL